MKLAGWLVTLGVLGGGAAWLSGSDVLSSGDAEAPSTGSLYTVERGTLNVTLTENGTLLAKDSRKVSADLESGSKITWLIDEGAIVEEGEIVVRLDSSEFEDDVEVLELDIVQARASLETAQTEKEIQETDNISAIEKAEIARDKAIQEEKRYLEGDAPKERRNLEIAIKEAETSFTRAKKRYEDSKLLIEQEFINRSQFEEDEIAYERTEVQREGALRDLELFEQYTFPMTTTERAAAVRENERGFETAKKRAESQLLQRQVNVDQYQKRLTKLEKRLTEAHEQIEKSVLAAPVPGIVLYGDPQQPWRRDEIRVGADVWGDMVLCTIPDLRVMQIKLRIHEADISKLDEGQTAKITLDTFPGVVLDGEVTRIGNIAAGDNRWEQNPEVKKFDVEVTLTGDLGEVEIRPGVSAKAEIFIEEKSDVLFVPIQCVVLEEGQHLTYVMSANGSVQTREVTPGIGNEVYVEILEGLEEGDRVLLYNPNVPSSGNGDGEEGDDAKAVMPSVAPGPGGSGARL